MVKSYKQRLELKDHYNTIIIGSGMGSLATAALLSKQGQSVLVLEKHYTAGGFTHIFKRRGYEWDVGIHYIGEVQRPKSVLKKLFDYVTDGNLKWADMGDVYDRVVIGEKSYDFVKGVKNFKNQMTFYFPDEKDAIDKYVDLVFKANKTSRNFYLSKALRPLLSFFLGRVMRKPYLHYSDKTTYEVLRTLSDNETFIKVLTSQYGDYGLPPKQSSFAMQAAVARHYFSGGSFPIGGSSEIVNTISPIISKSGGDILVSAEVDKVIVEENKAVGVKMKDGEIISGDNIVSGAGVIVTYEHLLERELVEKHGLLEHLKNVKPSVAHACLYIGLNGSPEELDLPKNNLWIYPDDVDHDTAVSRYLVDQEEEFPVIYISFPAAKDPDWSNRYPGRSTIDIITLVPYEAFQQWEGKKWKKRGEEYEAKKEKIAQRLLEALYKQLPQVKGKIDVYELSTPITTKHFVNYQEGEIYGLDHSPSRFRQDFLKPRTPIKNFYLTGQDIVTCGVGAALFSGLITASAMTGVNIMKDVMSQD